MYAIREQAAQHTRTAARMYRQARADARRAAQFYASAHLMRQTALMPRTEYVGTFDRSVYDLTRVADMYLQASFRATENARFYADLAREYLAMSV